MDPYLALYIGTVTVLVAVLVARHIFEPNHKMNLKKAVPGYCEDIKNCSSWLILYHMCRYGYHKMYIKLD